LVTKRDGAVGNPYHDSTGAFSSVGALDSLQLTGAQDHRTKTAKTQREHLNAMFIHQTVVNEAKKIVRDSKMNLLTPLAARQADVVAQAHNEAIRLHGIAAQSLTPSAELSTAANRASERANSRFIDRRKHTSLAGAMEWQTKGSDAARL